MSVVRGVLAYLGANRATVTDWFAWHAGLSVVPVVLGLVLALPAGWMTQRWQWLRGPVLGLASALYTIPSLALFVLMPTVLGTRILDPVNVVAALTVYSFALLVRVVTDALAAVPAEVVDVADGLGVGRLRRLLTVELPLAVPVVVAGLRVATVSSVSLVSVAALVGIPQLGQLFTLGFSTLDAAPIVLGLVGCALLAVLLDGLLVAAGWILTPWRRAGTP